MQTQTDEHYCEVKIQNTDKGETYLKSVRETKHKYYLVLLYACVVLPAAQLKQIWKYFSIFTLSERCLHFNNENHM